MPVIINKKIHKGYRMKTIKKVLLLLALSSVSTASYAGSDLQNAALCSGVYQGLVINEYTSGKIGESRFKKNMRYANGFYFEMLNFEGELNDNEAVKRYSVFMTRGVNHIVTNYSAGQQMNQADMNTIIKCGFMISDIYYNIAKERGAILVPEPQSSKNIADTIIQRVRSK